MIKTDGKQIYISCGESCYCIPVGDGLRAAYFGKRIETEDKLSELFGFSEPEFFIEIDGKIKSGFVFVSAETMEKCECSFPTLKGDKTVKLLLEDKKQGLTAEIFYTPYTRGAVARRCVIKNTGNKKTALRVPSASLILNGEYEKVACQKDGVNYFELIGDSDAYGVLTLFGGKCISTYSSENGITKVSVTPDKDFILAPGEKIETPETVLVRSEYGADGVMRAYHDILREYAVPARFNVNRRRVVFSSDSADTDSVSAAAELGADALLVPIDAVTPNITQVSELCKKTGMLFGAKADITKSNLSDQAEVGEIYAKIHNIIESLGVTYVAFSVDENRDYDAVLGLYALIKKLEKAHPEIVIQGTGDVALLCYTPIFGRVDTFTAFVMCGALCRVVPPSAIVCYITGDGSLKNEFDLCSLGALGYLPTVARSQNARLAVRAQVFSYQDDSPLVLVGDFYRPKVSRGDFALSVVSKDKSKAYAVYRKDGGDRLCFAGLDNHNLYHVREMDTVFSGAALSGVGVPVPPDLKKGDTVSFHLRQVADYEQ